MTSVNVNEHENIDPLLNNDNYTLRSHSLIMFFPYFVSNTCLIFHNKLAEMESIQTVFFGRITQATPAYVLTMSARMPVLSLNILTFNNLIAKKHFNGTHLRMYTELHIDKIL